MKKILLILLVIGLAGCSSGVPSATAKLSKADAAQLLSSMGYETVVVATVVNGAVATHIGDSFYTFGFGGPNMAYVKAYGERSGKPVEIVENFVFDQDLGWIYTQIDTQQRRVRLWTTSGYKDLRPGPKK